MPNVAANGITLEYDERGDPSAPALILTMGLGVQLIGWPDELCDGLAAHGFRVIRYDNRDIGLSTKIESAGVPDLAQALEKLTASEPVDAPYTLDDMADDLLELIDALGIDRAHLVGASMGGMISQIAAARRDPRVRSLVSIMSSSGNPNLPMGKPEAYAALFAVRPPVSERDELVRHMIGIYRQLAGPGFPRTDDEVRERVETSLDRAYDPPGFARQTLAALTSGDRREFLRLIDIPTLVVHGLDDPLVPIDAGRDIADTVPGARLHEMEGMGHEIPPGVVAALVRQIASHCNGATQN